MSSDMSTDRLDMTLADISKERKKTDGKPRGAKGAKRNSVKGRGTVQGNARNKARANTQRNRSANRSDVVAQRRGIVNTPNPSAKRGNTRNTNNTFARNIARHAINRQQTRTRIQSTVQTRRMNVARASPLKISLGAGNSRSIAGSRIGGALNRRAGGSGILGRLSTGSQRVSATTTKLRQARVNRAAILRPSSLLSRQSSLANRRNERTQQGSRSRNAMIDARRGIITPQPASNRNRGGGRNNNNNRGGNRGSPSPAAGRQTLSAIFAANKKPNNNNNNRNGGGRNNNSNYNNNRGGGFNNNNNNSRPKLVLGSGNSGGNRGGNRRGGRN